MKVVIIGLGRTGTSMIKSILDENHDVTVIDKSHDAVETAMDKYNVRGFVGSGASRPVLLKAGVADADIVIAATETDEVNLMCSMMVRSLGTSYVVAVLRNPDFVGETGYIKTQFGISYIINPELDTAIEISNIIKLPLSIKAEAFFSNKVTITQLPIDDYLDIDGLSVNKFNELMGTNNLLICSIRRSKNAFVPNGSFVLKKGDIIDVIASRETLNEICERFGIIRKPVKSVMMVGCGTIGLYLAKMLCKMKLKVKIIEFDKKRCGELLEELPNAEIVYGDGLESGLLVEEGIKHYDACISLTGDDESNLVIAMFAWSCGVHPIITKILSPSYAEILKGVEIDYTVSPTLISMRKLLRYIRIMENQSSRLPGDIKALYKIIDGRAEAIEFYADQSFDLIGIPLASDQFNINKNTIIAAIIRSNEVIIPHGTSTIEKDDRVIVVTLCGNKYNQLNDILKKK